MLNLLGRAFLTVVISWVIAVIVDRIMTSVVTVVRNAVRTRKTAAAK